MQELVVAQAIAAPAAQWASGSAAAKAAKAKAGEGPEAWPRARERGGPEEIADFGQLLAALCLGGQAPAGAAAEVAAPAVGVAVSGEPGTTAAALAAQAPLLTLVWQAVSGEQAQGGEGAPTRPANAEAVAIVLPLAGQDATSAALATPDTPKVAAALPAAEVPEEGLSCGVPVKAAPEQGEPAAGQGNPGKVELTGSPVAGSQADRLPIAELVARPPADAGAAPVVKEHGPQGRPEHDGAVTAAARLAGAASLGAEAPEFAGVAARELSPANLAREIVTQGLAVWQRGYGYVRLKLEPEFLGHLDLRVTSHLGHLSAHLVVENEAVRSLVQACLPFLEQNLAQHGLSLARFQVEVGGSGAGHTAGGFERPASGGGYNYPSSGGRTNWWAEQERPANGFFLVNYLA